MPAGRQASAPALARPLGARPGPRLPRPLVRDHPVRPTHSRGVEHPLAAIRAPAAPTKRTELVATGAVMGAARRSFAVASGGAGRGDATLAPARQTASSTCPLLAAPAGATGPVRSREEMTWSCQRPSRHWHCRSRPSGANPAFPSARRSAALTSSTRPSRGWCGGVAGSMGCGPCSTNSTGSTVPCRTAEPRGSGCAGCSVVLQDRRPGLRSVPRSGDPDELLRTRGG